MGLHTGLQIIAKAMQTREIRGYNDVRGFLVGLFICGRSVRTWSFSRNYKDHISLSTLPANS